MDVFEQLSLAGLVPVIKVENAEDAVPLCRALSEGGLPVAEITFRTPAAEEAIRRVHEELPNVLLCAGTVLTPEQVDRAADAGASAIVSPGLNPDVVRHALSVGIPVCPGISSPSGIEQAMALGLDTVKVFPAEAIGGLKLIQAMAAPYGNLRFMPTGGINENNMLEYLACPHVLCCGGSWMVPGEAVREKNWQRITDLTCSAVSRMLGFELVHVGINCVSAEESLTQAKLLCRLFGLNLKEGNSSNFAGKAFEMMKAPGRGANGHIAIATHSVARARWHLEQRGFACDAGTAKYKNGRLTVIYLHDEIGGFAFHLVEK